MEVFSLALGPGEIRVVFQPIVDLRTRKQFAVEALVRCQAKGFESPPRLFDDALQKGYIGRLGRLIRELTIQGCGGVAVFTNVHPQELMQRWLIRPDDPIYSHDNDVYIEITESVPFSHFDICHSTLKEIQSRGSVHLVIDDLGAGFSNLQRIVDLNPSIVKLDMQLIRGIHENRRKQLLVRSIVSMCVDQGARVVAEGIETADELYAVIDTGAHFGQGYLLARPAAQIPPINWPERRERRAAPVSGPQATARATASVATSPGAQAAVASQPLPVMQASVTGSQTSPGSIAAPAAQAAAPASPTLAAPGLPVPPGARPKSPLPPAMPPIPKAALKK
jgi:EAL domain-containing protein (putative c-di-GMP-specific phosphodiesterase class I)